MKYAYTGALVTLAASATAQAQEVTIDLTGIGSWDSPGSASNIVLTEALPAGSIVSGVTWTDVTGSGLGGPSWGNEMSMNINGEVDVQFFPAEGSGSAGGNWGPASGSAAATFATDELVIEFYEGYDDGPGVIDAEYTGGTITISYGTASDCNGNGVDDASELGPDTDCDMSGVLDECESLTDCDLNGVPDVCEGGEGVPNDLFENAIAMDLNGQVTGNTECASEEATFGDQCSTSAFTGDGPDVFYSISLVEAGTIDLWTCNSDYDTDLSIHNLDGSVVVCDGDSGDDNAADGCVQYASRINTLLQAGDYVVRVGGYEGATGTFVLDSSFVAGDPCAGDPQIFNVVSAADFIDQIGPGLADLCPGDIINWGPGVYNWGYTISLAANGVIHRGSVDADGNPTTIITGANSRQCLTFFGVEIYENMIFEDGVSGGDGGAFILNPQFGKVTFRNCVFRNNTAGSLGGAVCNLGAQNGSEFIDCLFVGNSARDAGACIALQNGADGAIFTNCEFRNNTAQNTGGAICTAGGSPTANGCLFTNNTGSAGGGIYIQNGDTATVSNSILCGNTPDQYAGPGTFDDQGGNEISASCDANDCNGNGIPDGDELDGNDCNDNGTLDECELFGNDCDDNGALDECDLADGAEDSDANGVLDVCQAACEFNTACDGGDAVYPADQGALAGTGGVACAGGGISTENTFLNVYDADTVNPDGYALSCVAVPVFNGGSFMEATVQVVSIPDPSAPSINTMVVLGQGTVCMESGVTELTFDAPIAIDAGSAFGILMDVPPSADGFVSYDETTVADGAATYILSGSCGLTDFVGYPGIGFPDPEWTIQMSFVADEEPCTGDLNGDGEVGFGDLQLILSAWESSTDGDANGDGVTNFADLQVILSAWGGC
jgi:hypothetical protein